MPLLLAQHLFAGLGERLERMLALRDAPLHGEPHRLPQYGGEQERRIHRLAFLDAQVGIGQRLRQQHAREVRVLAGKAVLGEREQKTEQVEVAQHLVGFERVAALKQFQHFLEHARRRDIQQQVADVVHRVGRGRVDPETELGSKPHHAQHAHRVLAETRRRVADHAHQAGLEVGDAAHVILHREVADVVVQGVDRDVAPHRVFVLAAEHVVGQQPAGLVDVVVGLALFLAGVRRSAEGRDLDNVLPVADMRQTEASADQARIAEQFLDLLRARVGDDIEIFGFAPQHQVAHAAAHEKTRVAGIFQAIQDFKRAVADEVAGDGVLRAGNDQRLSDGGYPAVLFWPDSCLRCENKSSRYNTISSQVGGKKACGTVRFDLLPSSSGLGQRPLTA